MVVFAWLLLLTVYEVSLLRREEKLENNTFVTHQCRLQNDNWPPGVKRGAIPQDYQGSTVGSPCTVSRVS